MSAKRICLAAIIAALYASLSLVFGSLSYQGFLQIRPAEALCVLPLFFPEAVVGLTVGCVIANTGSPFFLYDVIVGSSLTLVSSLITLWVGRKWKDRKGFLVGGLFPVLFNGFGVPFIIVFLCGDFTGGVWTAYFTFVASVLATEAVWVYGLGGGLYASIKRLLR